MPKTHKTIVYIDGYNFYYGRLKDTDYKWLDICKLFINHIVKERLPNTEVQVIKFFTSNVKANFCSHGNDGVNAQQNYHRALKQTYPHNLEIIYGYHQDEAVHMPTFLGQGAVDKKNATKVWKLTEKQTDVNIALHVYRDAIQQNADAIVICSNDSDLEPALRMIRDEALPVEIGIVIPKSASKANNARPANQKLSALADWTRAHINDNELFDSQLPDSIPTNKKPIKKPDYW
jgi:uncharacterized LabA/DUF88 family protein